MAVSRWRSTLTAVSCRPSLTRYMVMFAFPLRNPSAAEMFLGDIEDAVGSLERFPYAHMVRPGSNAAGRCEECQSSTAKSAVHSISSKMESKTVRVVRVAKHRRHIISQRSPIRLYDSRLLPGYRFRPPLSDCLINNALSPHVPDTYGPMSMDGCIIQHLSSY